LPADRSDFDVHGAIDNDQVWIHSICLPVSTVLVVKIIVIIGFICIIVLKWNYCIGLVGYCWTACTYTLILKYCTHCVWSSGRARYQSWCWPVFELMVAINSHMKFVWTFHFFNLLLLGLLWLLLLLCRLMLCWRHWN
jgi:hypothetical protein